MKRMIFKIINLIAIAFLCLTAYSQSSENKIKTREEQEVKRFADSFLDSFIEKKDISKIPARFFEKDFKKRFGNEGFFQWSTFNDKKIPNSIRYKVNINLHNFFNLLMMTASRNYGREKYTGSEDKILSTKYLPPNIAEKLKKSKWLKFILEDDNSEESSEETDPITLSKLQNLIEEMSAASADTRAYLQNHPVKNSPNFLKFKKDNFKYYPAEICEGESCMGLPEKTPIFAVH